MEAGDHPEKAWARTARGPVHVGVFVWTGVAQFAVGADIVDGQNIFAGRPESSAVPAKAALQQEAAKPYAPTMADGKEQLLRGEELIHLVAAAAGADHRAHRLRSMVTAFRRDTSS